LQDGNVDALLDLFDGLDTIRDSKAVLESLRDESLEQLSEFVDNLLKAPNAENNPLVWVFLLDEMLTKAMINDTRKYGSAYSMFPVQHFYSSMKEAVDGTQGSTVSFSHPDVKPAKEMFTTLYENYKELCSLFSRLASIANDGLEDKTRGWRNPFPQNGSRYHCLSVSNADTFIRNAISHKKFRRLEVTKFELADRHGKHKRFYSPSFLDERLNLLASKVRFATIGLSMSHRMYYQMALKAIQLNQVRSRLQKTSVSGNSADKAMN